MKLTGILGILLGFGLAIRVSAQSIQWPNGAKAAICLTYDDGMYSQIEQAIPALDAAGLRGTFFLNAIQDISLADYWRKAAGSGHELGNHTLFHPCLGASGWKPEWALENYTFDRIFKEISAMNAELYLLDGRKTARSFAFPCTETKVGGVSYVDSLRRSGLARFARIGGNADAVVTSFATLDTLLVPAWGVGAGTSAPQLIAFAEKAAQQGGLGVYMFHGVGSQWIAVSAAEHRKLTAYLAAHRHQYWVTTFSEAMDYVSRWRQKQLQYTRK